MLLQCVPAECSEAYNSFVRKDLAVKPAEEISTQPAAEESLSEKVVPLIIYTVTLVEQHGRQILRESAIFLKEVLHELNEFPQKSETINLQIKNFESIITRFENIDLDDDSPAAIAEKSKLLDDVTASLAQTHFKAEAGVSQMDADIWLKVFRKVDFMEFHKNIYNMSVAAVGKFSKIFEIFWSSLGHREKEQLSDLHVWSTKFYATDEADRKFRQLYKLFEIFDVFH